MTHPHLIDSAIFDTTLAAGAAAAEQKSSLEEFLRKELMNVVDEVFDKIDGNAGISEQVLRIPRLELDLGEIPYPEYRQQMPRKLREQLILALEKLRHPAGGRSQQEPGLADGKSARQEPLFYYLLNGYLPWYSRLDGVDALESLLGETLETTPARLVDFMHENRQHQSVMERLKKQFSKTSVERVLRLLSPAETERGDVAAPVDESSAQLVEALRSGDYALMQSSWQALYIGYTGLLEKILRQYGQQAIVRHHLAEGFSTARFDELLRLLEPTAYEQLRKALDDVEKFDNESGCYDTDRPRRQNLLREYTLAYLLVEGGGDFDELSQRLHNLTREASASASAINPAEPYRRYDRVMRLLATGQVERQLHAPDLLADLKALAQDSPWLLMRLYRELQSGILPWQQVVASLPLPQLATLTEALLAMSIGSDPNEAALGASELGAAVRSNAAKAFNRRSFYAQVLSCLIKGELIDFDAIGAAADEDEIVIADSPTGHTGGIAADLVGTVQGMPAASEHAPRELLQCAELLTTASYAAGISFSAAQLDGIKWRYIEAYLADTGNFFNERYFSHHYVETLTRQLEVSDTRRFRESLSEGLRQNSLPSTRDMTRRLVDLLADESGVVTAAETADAGEPRDESSMLENIYIDNAGAVLMAPYLPRLFERLGLTDEEGFKDRAAAERGVHCVQFLVNASTSSPEYQLVLNKLLCGIRPGRPIRRDIELAAGEKEQLEGLLQAVIENWKVLGNTSIAGLRESFLQRNGRLQLENDAWRLLVEARPFDVLLDQVPWSFSTIKFSWMDRVIYVEWR